MPRPKKPPHARLILCAGERVQIERQVPMKGRPHDMSMVGRFGRIVTTAFSVERAPRVLVAVEGDGAPVQRWFWREELRGVGAVPEWVRKALA